MGDAFEEVWSQYYNIHHNSKEVLYWIASNTEPGLPIDLNELTKKWNFLDTKAILGELVRYSLIYPNGNSFSITKEIKELIIKFHNELDNHEHYSAAIKAMDNLTRERFSHLGVMEPAPAKFNASSFKDITGMKSVREANHLA